MSLRPIAIYLPQFHPIRENDEWWEKGFTEWTNVTKAKPLFEGHYQPHLPADLGFYDLRLAETRQAQAELAKAYGIEGFCYYHYWFNGRRILERPFQEVFESGEPDFPFMLCWANENWTRIWDGGDKNMLLEQKYSSEDDLNHIRSLIPFFKDPRYIRIDNKPVFAVYRSTLFPDMAATIKTWRDEAALHGIELYLCRFESHGIAGIEYMQPGFDAAIEFQPQVKHKVPADSKAEEILEKSLLQKFSPTNIFKSIAFRYNRFSSRKERAATAAFKEKYPGYVSYESHAKYALSRYQNKESYTLYRSVCPGWDNSARRTVNCTIMDGSTPDIFGKWAAASMQTFEAPSKDENLFFINAWNEWAEGNHMEPDRKWGRQYLEAFKKALSGLKSGN